MQGVITNEWNVKHNATDKELAVTDPMQWAAESFKFDEDFVYTGKYEKKQI